MKKILVTGANGFVGQNVVAEFQKNEEYTLFLVDIDTPEEEFTGYLKECDFVLHLAGVNRPKEESEFESGNAGLTEWLLARLNELGNAVPVLLTSSIQSDLDNAYGRSKRQAEEAVLRYGRENGVTVYVFKLPNLFGKWSRPNYNSVVSTFCHNIVRRLPIEISDPERELTLVYIDDLLLAIGDALAGRLRSKENGYCEVKVSYRVTLGQLADSIRALFENRESLLMPELKGLNKALYSTLLSYLDGGDFSYPLTEHSDPRGSFYEFFKTKNGGQMSISTTTPGVTRGNHWHHTKVEKFLVVAGEADIRFRKIGDGEVITYRVSGEKPEAVDIPVGYTHSITNVSKTKTLITLIWANELFDPEYPDTFFEEV